LMTAMERSEACGYDQRKIKKPLKPGKGEYMLLPRRLQALSIWFLMGMFFSPALVRAETLPIRPLAQETPVWCWVAVGAMVLNYYDVPTLNPAGDYQCGIIAARFGPGSICWVNCRACQVPAGAPSEITRMLREYPPFAGTVVGRRISGLTST